MLVNRICLELRREKKNEKGLSMNPFHKSSTIHIKYQTKKIFNKAPGRKE